MHRMQLLVSSALISALSIGCIDVRSDAPDGARRVAIRPVPADERLLFSGVVAQERLVVRDTATWETVWQRVTCRPEPAPAIDFATEVVIVAAMGMQNSGGHWIDIDKVHTLNGHAWVSVTESFPGEDCAAAGVLTYPAFMVAAPRYDGETTFVEHAEQHACK